MNINGIEIEDHIFDGMISEVSRQIIDGDKQITEQQQADIVKNLNQYFKYDIYELLRSIARGGEIENWMLEESRYQFKSAVYPIAREIVMDMI